MTPVVGKAMEATLVVLYLGLVTTALYGGAVAEYRGTAGEEVAERTLADAATDIEAAVPPEATTATTRLEVDFPPTIAGAAYTVRARPDELVLDHPDPRISATAPLVLPDRIDSVSGTFQSGGTTTIHVEATDAGAEVHLE